jgi:hydroxyacyl-ACP dehydratase HTD2-like protein with hotdog domain
MAGFRNWIFRPSIISPSPPSMRPMEVSLPPGTYTKDIIQTSISLFRFSALTFNGHKIHYNREWCQQVEGHRDLVVHGPLNLINMMDFWRDIIGDGEGGQRWPKKINYRATNPLYAGERYRIIMDKEREGLTNLRIIDSYGKVSMVGTIEREL